MKDRACVFANEREKEERERDIKRLCKSKFEGKTDRHKELKYKKREKDRGQV